MRATVASEIERMMEKDERVVLVGSDLGFGAMDTARRRFPDRFFMEGISEQYVIGMAAGLAMEGFVPFVVSIASFLTRRCLEQIAVDVCLHDLPVRLIGNGAGAVYAHLGPTHMALDDVAILRALPNLIICAPGDRVEARAFAKQSVALPGPMYLRLGPPAPPQLPLRERPVVGRGAVLRDGGSVVLIGTGTMSQLCLAAADDLARQGISASVLHFGTVWPLDTGLLSEAADGAELIVTVEEHCAKGGLGSAVAESLSGGFGLRVLRLGLPAALLTMAPSRDELLVRHGLGRDDVVQTICCALAAD